MVSIYHIRTPILSNINHRVTYIEYEAPIHTRLLKESLSHTTIQEIDFAALSNNFSNDTAVPLKTIYGNNGKPIAYSTKMFK